MPLARGTILGFDALRMTYKFTMMDGPHIIDCQISSAALDDLAGQRSKPPRVLNRDARFLEFRDQIEKLASDQFDRDMKMNQIIASVGQSLVYIASADQIVHGLKELLLEVTAHLSFTFSHAFRAIRLALYSGSVAYR